TLVALDLCVEAGGDRHHAANTRWTGILGCNISARPAQCGFLVPCLSKYEKFSSHAVSVDQPIHPPLSRKLWIALGIGFPFIQSDLRSLIKPVSFARDVYVVSHDCLPPLQVRTSTPTMP